MLIPLSEFGLSLDSPGLGTWFEGFAGRNKDAVGDFEITAEGELKIMAPTGVPGELFELEMAAAVLDWSREHGGRTSGATACFVMPDGALLGPDASWISQERWDALPDEARMPFAAIVPDFIVEIVSPSNRGPELADKVRRYLEGGARLVLGDPSAQPHRYHTIVPARNRRYWTTPKRWTAETYCPASRSTCVSASSTTFGDILHRDASNTGVMLK